MSKTILQSLNEGLAFHKAEYLKYKAAKAAFMGGGLSTSPMRGPKKTAMTDEYTILRQRLVTLLRTEGPHTSKQAAAKFPNYSLSTICNRLSELKARGEIKQEKRGSDWSV